MSNVCKTIYLLLSGLVKIAVVLNFRGEMVMLVTPTLRGVRESYDSDPWSIIYREWDKKKGV